MIKLPSIAVYALMAPAIALGMGSAFATESSAAPADTKEERTMQEDRQMPEHAQKEKGMATADRAQEQHMAAERAKKRMTTRETYLSSAPANSFHSDELIGVELKSRSNDEAIGTISDLIVDENGQIAAVIVEAGGFLGLGEKAVAVSWNSIERHSNEKGGGYDFTVDTTKEALQNAPEYKTKAEQDSEANQD